MEGIRAVFPDYEDKDEHIIRRLGWAVIKQWEYLPESVRERLQRQANVVEDRYKTVNLREQISVFIKEHTPDQDA